MSARISASAFAALVALLGGCACTCPTASSSPAAVAVEEPAPHQTQISRAELRSLLDPPDAAFEHGRYVPVSDDETQRGYRLFGLRVGQLLARVGLLNGDLVLRVNGVALSSTHVAREVVDGLLEADAVELLIERRGEETTLRVVVTP